MKKFNKKAPQKYKMKNINSVLNKESFAIINFVHI